MIKQIKKGNIVNNILELENTTRIVVLHTLDKSFLSKFDEILVIDNGCLVEHGSYNDLMNKKQYLYSLSTITMNKQD